MLATARQMERMQLVAVAFDHWELLFLFLSPSSSIQISVVEQHASIFDCLIGLV